MSSEHTQRSPKSGSESADHTQGSESDLSDQALTRIDGWRALIVDGRTTPKWVRRSPTLQAVHSDADAFDFVRDICDYVALPRDAFAAALGLHGLAQQMPESLPMAQRIAMRVGGIASLGLPWGVVPLVKQRFRAHVADILTTISLSDDPVRGDDSSDDDPSNDTSNTRSEQRSSPRGSSLRHLLQKVQTDGIVADLLLLGAPVFGLAGAEREARRLISLTQHPEVSHLTITLDRLVPSLNGWNVDDAVQHPADTLRRVFASCLANGVTPTIAVYSYQEALLAPELLRSVLADESCNDLVTGVEVLAELPESAQILEKLLEFATSRVVAGHAPIEVRLSTRTIAGLETIASIERGLPVPTFDEPAQADAQLMRLLSRLLDSGHSNAVRAVLATEDPTFLSVAIELAKKRSLTDMLTVQLRRGLSPELTTVLASSDIEVRVATPVVRTQEFGHAFSTILTVLSDVVKPDSAFAITDNLFGTNASLTKETRNAEQQRVNAALLASAKPSQGSHRLQDRSREWDPSERDSALFYRPPTESTPFDTGGLTAAVLSLSRVETGAIRLEPSAQRAAIPVLSQTGFACEPDTDETQPGNRVWVRARLRQATHDRNELSSTEEATESEEDQANWQSIITARKAGEAWASWSHQDRATKIRRAALATVAARDQLSTVLATERGLPVAEIDAEINNAVDAARYLANRAEGLRTVRGAKFRPDPLTLLIADAYTPFAVLAEALAAALSAGSGVVFVAHQAIGRSASALIKEWEAAGIPEGTVTLLTAENDAPSSTTDPFVDIALAAVETSEIDRVLFLGDAVLAEHIRRRRPDVLRDMRVRGHGTIILTSSADQGASVTEVVRSALAQAGTHPRATRALILTGSMMRASSVLANIADAVSSITVGDSGAATGEDPLTFAMGPLPLAPDEAGLRALTQLAAGEEWLVQPEQLDEAGRLWSPGMRTGMKPGAKFWQDSLNVPVLGVVRAHSLDEAIQLQHEIGSGAVAGLQSLDTKEILPWLEQTRAASLVVNKGTTAARIERLPSGVWGDAQSEPQPLAGGPHRLVPLGSWQLRRGTQSETLHLRGIDPVVKSLIAAAQPALDYTSFDLARRAALTDALTWRTQFGRTKDTAGLGIEHNVLRYRAISVHIRFAEGADLASFVRVLAAGQLAGGPLTVSTGQLLPQNIRTLLEQVGIHAALERDEDWLERAAVHGSLISGEGEVPAARIRLIGGERVRVSEWLSSTPDVGVWAEPVTMAGPVELLGFLREQSISVATTRHGLAAPLPEVAEWLDAL